MPRPKGTGGRHAYDKYRRFTKRSSIGRKSNGRFTKKNGSKFTKANGRKRKSRFDK